MDILVERGRISLRLFFAVILRHVAPRAAAPAVTNTMEQLLICFG